MTFQEFILPFSPLFNKVTRSYGLSYTDSQDVIQETTISLWKKFSEGRINSSQNVQAYVSRLINWRAKDMRRRILKRAELFSLPNEDNNLDALLEAPKPLESPHGTKIWAFARKALKGREFEIFADYFLHGKTANETALQFNLDKQNVYLVRCRALKKVKKYKCQTSQTNSP